jgi:hypothetical protein
MSKRQRRRLQERRNLQRTRSRWIIGAKLPVTLAIATAPVIDSGGDAGGADGGGGGGGD